MTVDPGEQLSYSATYTTTVKGGDDGVKDVAGNALANDRTWTFTTADEPPLPPDEGPGGPVLVISKAENAFTRYYAEILRAEGLNAFTVKDERTVDAETLDDYDVVILGEMSLSAVQVAMLEDWVSEGGNLIAMRPDPQLAGLLGVSAAPGALANAYLRVDTGSGPGKGIVAETMQFHGTADLYALNGATSLATLYGTATTATVRPAVTLRSVDSNGGQAAAFTYDLAKSIIYTRQGNPAWAGQERDGRGGKRTGDMFYGAAPGDPQPDWVDLNKVAIPQADEQQRLLANLIETMNRDRKPLPRFWYFPRGEEAVILMTGDDHANNGTPGRFDRYKQLSPAGCSRRRLGVRTLELIHLPRPAHRRGRLPRRRVRDRRARPRPRLDDVGDARVGLRPRTQPVRRATTRPCRRRSASGRTASCGVIGRRSRRSSSRTASGWTRTTTTGRPSGFRTGRECSPAPACRCGSPTPTAR